VGAGLRAATDSGPAGGPPTVDVPSLSERANLTKASALAVKVAPLGEDDLTRHRDDARDGAAGGEQEPLALTDSRRPGVMPDAMDVRMRRPASSLYSATQIPLQTATAPVPQVRGFFVLPASVVRFQAARASRINPKLLTKGLTRGMHRSQWARAGDHKYLTAFSHFVSPMKKSTSWSTDWSLSCTCPLSAVHKSF
jgi:hypothetical protein